MSLSGNHSDRKPKLTDVVSVQAQTSIKIVEEEGTKLRTTTSSRRILTNS